MMMAFFALLSLRLETLPASGTGGQFSSVQAEGTSVFWKNEANGNPLSSG